MYEGGLKCLFIHWLYKELCHSIKFNLSWQARSQGGGGRGGRSPPPPPQVAPPKCQKKRGKGRERENRKIKLRVCMWSYRLPTISKVRLNINLCYNEENTRHMHQIAPLTTSKCKKLSHSHTLPPSLRSARSGSVASLPRTLFLPPPLKLNPGYATVSW